MGEHRLGVAKRSRSAWTRTIRADMYRLKIAASRKKDSSSSYGNPSESGVSMAMTTNRFSRQTALLDNV